MEKEGREERTHPVDILEEELTHDLAVLDLSQLYVDAPTARGGQFEEPAARFEETGALEHPLLIRFQLRHRNVLSLVESPGRFERVKARG